MNILKNYSSKGIIGIKHDYLQSFIDNIDLNTAINRALKDFDKFPWCLGDIQDHMLNFYPKNTIVPYIPISAQGPWIITHNAAIVYDVGGYGMLGFGHSPQWALDTLSKPHIMANIMTPNLIQRHFSSRLNYSIGMNRREGSPYSNFACLNSGSEAIELATRITDLNTKLNNVNDKKSTFIVLKGSFHGRTMKAAQLSNSCNNTYNKYLNSFRDNIPVHTVEVNNEQDLNDTILSLKNEYLIEGMIMEPVMGEGNPGIPITPSFYQLARKITRDNNSHLIIDSVQSALRTRGYLSIVDYPGFENLESPDMEIFSKAISSGQFPISVLAVTPDISEIFKTGIYGNTMTCNPKGLEIAIETLNRINYDVIENINEKGLEFKKILEKLQKKYPEIATHVTGTGLLLALHISEKYPVVDNNGLEYLCRHNGLNVIHGGNNALRFTPHFKITTDEIKLVEKILDKSFSQCI